MSDDLPATAELIARARDGDRAALDILLDRYRPDIRRWLDKEGAAQRGKGVDVSDVAQDTLLYVFRAIGGFRGSTEQEFVVWLKQVLKHKLVDVLRKAGAEKRDWRRETPLNAIQFHRDSLGLQGKVKLPPALGSVELAIQGPNWLLFTDQGVRLTGGKLSFPPVKINMKGILELEATGLSVEYVGAEAENPAKLKIQGKVIAPTMGNFEADFAGENYIQFAGGEVDMVGKLSVEDIEFAPGVWVFCTF